MTGPPHPTAQLAAMGITLPAHHPVVGTYALVTRIGSTLHVSGHGPFVDGRPAYTGTLGGDVSVATGADAARVTMLNILTTLQGELGDLSSVARFVKLTVFVASTPDFTNQHLVANGATDLLVAIFGERGRTSRSSVGVAALPLGFCVEIEGIVDVQSR